MCCCLQSLTNSIKEATDAGRQKELLSSARLALRIFFSMNNPGLTEVRMLPFVCTTLFIYCRNYFNYLPHSRSGGCASIPLVLQGISQVSQA